MPKLSNDDAKALVEARVEPYYEHPERIYWEHRMWRNLAFLSGIQNFAQDPFGGIRPLRDKKGRPLFPRFTANLILPATERAVSKVTSSDPVFTARPNSTSSRDSRAARLAQRVFRWAREATTFEQKRNIATAYAAACGLGILKLTWDPDKGEKKRIYLAAPEELELMGLAQGTEYPVVDLPDEEKARRDEAGIFRDVATGGVRLDVVSPFGWYWDFDVRDGTTDEMEWCAQVDIVEVARLERQYGISPGTLAPDHGLDGGTLYEESAAVLHGGAGALNRWQGPGRGRHARTRRIEYWEAPNRDNDFKGRKVVFASGRTLENRENPYVKAGISLPFVEFFWFRRPGTHVSNDLVGHLTDSNRAYNQHAQHTIDVERHNGWPIIVTSKGADMKPHRLPNFAGLVLEVPMGSPPPFSIPPAQLPNYIALNQQARRAEISEISSQPDAARGASPGQVRGSQGVQALVSAGNEVMGQVLQAQHESVAQCGSMILKLVAAFQTKEQVASIRGEDDQVQTFMFRGEDLRGHTHIIIEGESRFAVDRIQRAESLIDLARNGAIDMQNPHDKRAVYRALQLQTGERFFDSQLANEDLAEEENEKLLEIAEEMALAGPQGVPDMIGEFPEARHFHDHATHLDVHNRFRLSKAYRELPPHAQKLVDTHALMHETFIIAQQQQMLQDAGGGQQPGSGPPQQGQGKQNGRPQSGDGNKNRKQTQGQK